jgi:hypothetical protein
MTKGKERIPEIQRESTRLPSVENSLCNSYGPIYRMDIKPACGARLRRIKQTNDRSLDRDLDPRLP